MSSLNAPNRTLAAMDNLPFPRSLNNERIDLIAIDPPFAANETCTGKPKPSISKDDFGEEVALAKKRGFRDHKGAGVNPPVDKALQATPFEEWEDVARSNGIAPLLLSDADILPHQAMPMPAAWCGEAMGRQ